MFINTFYALALSPIVGKAERHTSNDHRICPRCKTEKPLLEFHSKGQGRHEHICKICSNDKKAKRRERKKNAPNRRASKKRTFSFSNMEVFGELSSETIESFAKAYGNIILEALND